VLDTNVVGSANLPSPICWEIAMRIRDRLVALNVAAALAAGLIALVAVALPQPAAAAPKHFSSSCTMSDIQSPRAAACIRQAEQDILNDAPYSHFVICSNDGANAVCGSDMCCCQKGHGCTAIIARAPQIRPGLLEGALELSPTTRPSPLGTPLAPATPSRGLR
jgi:hypothetical protein